jgi:hypothetical protein
MKNIFVVALLFSIIPNCMAQPSFYSGEWTVRNTNTLYTCICKIDTNPDGKTYGEIIWTFKAIDKNNPAMIEYYKDKTGKKGIEIVSGNYLSDSRDMYLQTINMIDPDTVLGSTLYYLKLSVDKNTIYGGTTNPNGEQPGSFYAILDKKITQKQFDVIKSNVK